MRLGVRSHGAYMLTTLQDLSVAFATVAPPLKGVVLHRGLMVHTHLSLWVVSIPMSTVTKIHEGGVATGLTYVY